MSGLYENEIRSDVQFIVELARNDYSLDIVSLGLHKLDELFFLLTRRETDPEVLSYLAHTFTAFFGDKLVSEIGGQWGQTQDDGLQIEYIGNRRSLKLMKYCTARMLKLGARIPLEPEMEVALHLLADTHTDEVMSFETLYDILKSEQDAGGWRKGSDGWTIGIIQEKQF